MSSEQRTPYRVVFIATSEWLQIAEGQGLIVDWEAEPFNRYPEDPVADLARLANVSDFECSFNPSDSELGAAVLNEPRDCDTALRAGDIVLTSGPGGDVAFLRPTE